MVVEQADLGADRLFKALREANADVVRVNFDDQASWSLVYAQPQGSGRVTVNNANFDLELFDSIWCRNLGRFSASPNQNLTAYERVENLFLLVGCLETLPGEPTLVNSPARVSASEPKVIQLDRAYRQGFEIPASLHSNRADILERHCEVAHRDFRPLILKAVQGGTWTQDEVRNRRYTAPIRALDFSAAQPLSVAVTVQDQLDTDFEVRSFVLGPTVMSFSIAANNPYSDWRQVDDKDIRVAPIQLDPTIERRLVDLVQSFGLIYGAVDLVVTRNGRCVFLELNPGGQWDWFELKSGVAITAKLAELLTRGGSQ